MEYEIISFDSTKGSLSVKYTNTGDTEGITQQVEVPIVNGQYLTGDQLADVIKRSAPIGALMRAPQVGVIAPPQFELGVKVAFDPPTVNEQQQINLNARGYLTSTDWLVIREMDVGIPVPDTIKAARQAARDAIVTI